MASRWTGRILAGLATALAVACGSSLGSTPPAMLVAQADEPPESRPASPIAIVNTGKMAEAGFLTDFSKGPDEKTQYLSDYEMDTDWIRIAYRPRNIEFGRDGMTLNLLKTRGEKLPFSGSELQFTGFYGYGRYETILKASNAEGAVASFFTYTGESTGDPHDEIDIEVVGKNPRFIHLNYFHKGESDPQEIPLWFDAAAADHLYAFEWTPDAIRWFVDGRQIREVTSKTSGIGIPTTFGKLIANIWVGSGPAQDWTGEPRFHAASATYRCMSHVPTGATGKQCSDTFKAPPR